MNKHGGFFMSDSHSLLTLPETGFLRLSQVLRLVPICKTRWYAGVKNGEYPAPVKLGPRTSAYRAEAIRDLIERLGASEQG
jgi:predicted DNA-binding transcriptional regulator AlpA